MIYLKDTCVLIEEFDTLKIINTANLYKKKDTFALTDIIIDELYPGKSINVIDAEKSKSLLAGISRLEKSKALKTYIIKEDGKYKSNFNKIRKAFYGHLKDVNAVKEALKKGEITPEQFKNRTYLYKDYGECSCIAVAIENPDDIVIVSNDKGRIFLKPNINLFNKYEESNNIKVINYKEWEKIFDIEEELYKKA